MSFPAFKLVEADEDGSPLADLTILTLVQNPVPAALHPLLGVASTEAAGTFLMSLLKVIEARDLDRETTNAKVNPASNPDAKPELRVSEWGSGGGLAIFKEKLFRFKADDLTAFFGRLFEAVKGAIPGARFSRNNFFHGHAVLDKVDGDVDFRIVFHAYEYPKNLETPKSELAKKAEPEVPPFDDSQPSFYMRNAIWSMRSHKIVVPAYHDYLVTWTKEREDFPYCAVVRSEPPQGCVVEEAKVGEPIVGFNVFPSEGVKLFLKQ